MDSTASRRVAKLRRVGSHRCVGSPITARFATRGTSKKTTLGGTYPQPGTIRLPMPWHRNWTPVADGNWGP